MSTDHPPVKLRIKRARLEPSSTSTELERHDDAIKREEGGGAEFTEPLHPQLLSTFVGYFLHNRSAAVAHSYLDEQDENFYLVAPTPTEKFLRAFLVNERWANATRRHLTQTPYTIVFSEYGGRRVKEANDGRLLTDAESLKQSIESQRFLLFANQSLVHVLRFADIPTVSSLGFLPPKARGLQLGASTTRGLEKAGIPLADWLSELEDFDYFAPFPKTKTIGRVLDCCWPTLKRLHLPNHVDLAQIFPKYAGMELKKLDKSYVRFFQENATFREGDQVGLWRLFEHVNARTVEFSFNSLCGQPWGRFLWSNFTFNPHIRTLILTVGNEETWSAGNAQPPNEFAEWIDGVLAFKPEGLRKLVFANSTLFVPKDAHAEVSRSAFAKFRRLIAVVLRAPLRLARADAAADFAICGEFEVRRRFRTIRPNLRVDGDITTVVLVAERTGVSLQFRRGRRSLLRPPFPLLLRPYEVADGLTDEVEGRVLDEVLARLNGLDADT
ncbi:hypothetical protein M3Y99_00580300 [Aphelenchoides fujianensis]|nr:hypothetical protein M3Y99_00580300 [Aphelenchoides fujianensis]